MRFLTVLSVLFFLGVVCSSQILVGGYSEPTIGLLSDAHFLEVKSFIEQQHPELADAEITNISTQIVAGTNYKVHYKTQDGK